MPPETARATAPALEVVNAYLLEDLVPDETGRLVFAPGTYARALQFIMESQPASGWLVAGLGRLMRPGWPPVVAWIPPSYLGQPPDGT